MSFVAIAICGLVGFYFLELVNGESNQKLKPL